MRTQTSLMTTRIRCDPKKWKSLTPSRIKIKAKRRVHRRRKRRRALLKRPKTQTSTCLMLNKSMVTNHGTPLEAKLKSSTCPTRWVILQAKPTKPWALAGIQVKWWVVVYLLSVKLPLVECSTTEPVYRRTLQLHSFPSKTNLMNLKICQIAVPSSCRTAHALTYIKIRGHRTFHSQPFISNSIWTSRVSNQNRWEWTSSCRRLRLWLMAT